MVSKKKKSLSAAVVAAVPAIMAAVFVAGAAQPLLMGKIVTSHSPLNVRAHDSQSADVLTVLDKESYVKLLSLSGEWWKVEYAPGEYGYCHADYIRQLDGCSEKYVCTESDALNVRSGKSTDSTVKDSLERGESVCVLKNYGAWSRITYAEGKTGYVKSCYLSDDFQPRYPRILLEAVRYRQTDPRWAERSLGQSEKTIAVCGCTTSCLAMSESYLKNEKIYPDDMERQLSYSPSGSLYWPQTYATCTDDDGWMQQTYAALREGKPVILGAGQANGRQHWVLIRGYDGNGETLTSDGFIINDPSTAGRKRLSDLFADYPYFLKIAYYAGE